MYVSNPYEWYTLVHDTKVINWPLRLEDMAPRFDRGTTSVRLTQGSPIRRDEQCKYIYGNG